MRRVGMERDLRRAFANNELCLFINPRSIYLPGRYRAWKP